MPSELRKDSGPATAGDETGRPPVESTKAPPEVDSKKTGAKDVPKKANSNGHKKHRRAQTKATNGTAPHEGESSACTDDEADSTRESDSDSTSESETTDHAGKAKNKAKKNGLAPKKDVDIKKGKKRGSGIKGSRSKKSPKPMPSDSDSDSSDSDGEDDDEDDGDSQGLKQQLRALQLQLSQLQQQLPSSALSHPIHPDDIHPALTMPGLYAGNSSLGLNSSPSMPPRHMPIPPPGGVSFHGSRNRARGGPGLDTKALGLANGTAETQDERLKGKFKKASRAEYKRVDWIWDNSIYTYKLQDTTETAMDSRYDEYIFHVRRTFDCDGKYMATVVDIKSKLLRECLQDVIGNVKGVSLVDETPKLDPNTLFLYLEDFRMHLKQLKHMQPAGDSRHERKKNQKRLNNKRKQLKVLIKYLDKDYAKIKDSLYPMLDNGLITFDLLWALWKPNTLAVSGTYGSLDELRVFKVELAERQNSLLKGNFYYIDGKYFEFDGKRFGHGSLCEEIAEFQGARKISSLPCFPLKYHKEEQQLRKDMIERGKKFVRLSGVHYKSYSGMAYQKRKKNLVTRYNIPQSRIMVDPSIFRRINPNYQVSLVRPKDHDLLSDDEYSDDDSDNCMCGSSDDDYAGQPKIQFVTKAFKTPKGEICVARVPKDFVTSEEPDGEKFDVVTDANGNEGGDATNGKSNRSTADQPSKEDAAPLLPEFTDEEYLIASPVVLGFAFAEKQWLEFRVSDIKDIQWNESAWDSLVLEPATKDLIQALVQSRKFNAASTIDDVIQGKGKGLVTVLHGPPGTGKTLTAEGISELLKCPLYMASAGELGTDSRYLEAELQKILDICHAWGAILLLDEADVFLEKRNMHDIHRNALVSIFLRQLEYFQGILFLTTNRVETFDEAFQSRIHIALRYDALDSKAKKAIFEMFLERVRKHGKIELKEFTEDDMNVLAKHDLNGREIKNVIGSAQDLAVSKGEPLAMRHIRQVLDVYAKFGRDLRGGTGYEDAMRSYF